MKRFYAVYVLILMMPLLVTGCTEEFTSLETPQTQNEPQLAAVRNPDVKSEQTKTPGTPAADWQNMDNTALRPVRPQAVGVVETSPPSTAPTQALPPEIQPLAARVKELERDMAAMKQELNVLLPKLQRLINENYNNEETAQQAAVPKAKPEPKPAPKKKVRPRKTAQQPVEQDNLTPDETYTGAVRLANIRTGEHKGKSRLVLDVGSDTSFDYDLDNAENLLIIELPDAPLEEALSKQPGSKLIDSYKAQSASEGSRIILDLKRAVNVKTFEIRATKDRGHRIVFDLYPE